jgi:Predicted AAA-ATPase
MRKKLPIGIQTFREIREDGCYYADKTGFARDLIQHGKYYFLSRPRRFGKSLFLDTLKELFEGNEPLFRGLFVHDKWDWSIKYPVIRLNFSDGVLQSRQELNGIIAEMLRRYQEWFDVKVESVSNAGYFAELIRMVSIKCGQRVVVLVDEYDKPILDNIESADIAAEMREGLRDIYSVIKGADAYIKFAFLTGVSKFSKVSIFSGLNNLQDITINKRYSALCGYT